jgi:hypothetical protein
LIKQLAGSCLLAKMLANRSEHGQDFTADAWRGCRSCMGATPLRVSKPKPGSQNAARIKKPRLTLPINTGQWLKRYHSILLDTMCRSMVGLRELSMSCGFHERKRVNSFGINEDALDRAAVLWLAACLALNHPLVETAVWCEREIVRSLPGHDDLHEGNVVIHFMPTQAGSSSEIRAAATTISYQARATTVSLQTQVSVFIENECPIAD